MSDPTDFDERGRLLPFASGEIISARIRCPRGHEFETEDLYATSFYDSASIEGADCPECDWSGNVY